MSASLLYESPFTDINAQGPEGIFSSAHRTPLDSGKKQIHSIAYWYNSTIIILYCYRMKYNIYNLIGAYCVTPLSGQKIYEIIHPVLIDGTAVELNFFGVKAYAAPFFNYAIGQLLKDISNEDVNRLVIFSNLSSTGDNVLQMVMSSAKRYYTDESYRRAVHEIREEELAAY
jgi:STAS-like domain of unknown function (DUF4325)